ncbi:amino acid racemase [Pedobacter sp. MC2016-15]|uniref:aspartate/glutamate racemase family protein n=1 Tax=Pedobacter sp. MC2016-15 TaxID=2994473 RepID=UPI002247F3C0|nr:amino acid racemase [Pedobacter sp. MC2016-15]MCX2477675.1 amino acid racemase [Pedobacter sp. MC2016-15]
MKTIGIIGGLSPESTVVYYKGLNDGIRERTGRQHQAKITINSVDGGEIWKFRQQNDWNAQGKIVAEAALSLEKAGADFILLAGNTMHRVSDAIESVINLPFLHLIDVTAKRIKAEGITIVGLTGTSVTMTDKFYIERLAKFGITTIIPNPEDVESMDRIIYNELIWGIISPESRIIFTDIIRRLTDSGAEGVILGCTELTLFMPLNYDTKIFDTTQIHIEEALNLAIT